VQEDKGHARVAEGHKRKGGGIRKETTMAQIVDTQKNTRRTVEDTYIPRGNEGCHCPGDCDSVVHDVHTEVATNVCHPFAAMKYRCCRHNESTNRRGAHVSIFTRPSISQSWNRSSRDNNSTGGIQPTVLSTASCYDLVLRAPRFLSTLETGKLIRSFK
jgi:hypothetical protein